MNVKKVINAAFIAGLSLTTTSCYNQAEINHIKNRKNLLEEVMSERPQTELNRLKNSLDKGDAEVAEMQHMIDSIVFREMFEGSQQTKDSAFVSDYKALLAKTKTPLYTNIISGEKIADNNKINELIGEHLTVKEMKNIINNRVLPDNGGKGYFGSGEQYLLDSVYYNKLFEKYNMLNNNGLEKFQQLCEKVRP